MLCKSNSIVGQASLSFSSLPTQALPEHGLFCTPPRPLPAPQTEGESGDQEPHKGAETKIKAQRRFSPAVSWGLSDPTHPSLMVPVCDTGERDARGQLVPRTSPTPTGACPERARFLLVRAVVVSPEPRTVPGLVTLLDIGC